MHAFEHCQLPNLIHVTNCALQRYNHIICSVDRIYRSLILLIWFSSSSCPRWMRIRSRDSRGCWSYRPVFPASVNRGLSRVVENISNANWALLANRATCHMYFSNKPFYLHHIFKTTPTPPLDILNRSSHIIECVWFAQFVSNSLFVPDMFLS
jgi:hypothetical protein